MSSLREIFKRQPVNIHRLKNALLRRLYYRNPLNIYLGQKLYGNDSGYIANIVGNIALRKDRLFSRDLKTSSDAFKTEVAHFKQKGWVKLENIDFGDTLSILRKRLDEYCQSNQVPDSQRLEASSIGNSELFFKQFPEVKSILTEKLKQFIQAYYQANFRILNAHIYRIYPVPSHFSSQENYRPYGATACWHNDGSTVESSKLFVLIDDVDETQGPMYVIGADETKKIIRNKYFRSTIDGLPGSEFERKAKITKFTGKAGTILFANTNTCLHRASVPLSGKSRDMLVFYLSSNTVPLRHDWEREAVYMQNLGLSRLLNWYSSHE